MIHVESTLQVAPIICKNSRQAYYKVSPDDDGERQRRTMWTNLARPKVQPCWLFTFASWAQMSSVVVRTNATPAAFLAGMFLTFVLAIQKNTEIVPLRGRIVYCSPNTSLPEFFGTRKMAKMWNQHTQFLSSGVLEEPAAAQLLRTLRTFQLNEPVFIVENCLQTSPELGCCWTAGIQYILYESCWQLLDKKTGKSLDTKGNTRKGLHWIDRGHTNYKNITKKILLIFYNTGHRPRLTRLLGR